MQTGFVPKIRIAPEIIISKQLQVITFCERRNIPLIVLEMIGEGRTVDSLWDAITRVPQVFQVFKEENDGFTNGELLKILDSTRASRLLLMGINADYCVKATAKSALTNGYQIVTSADLVSGQHSGEYRHSKSNSALWYWWHGSFYLNVESMLRKEGFRNKTTAYDSG